MQRRTSIDYSLYLVTDRGMIGRRSLIQVIEESIQGGVTVVQLREKHASTREFFELAVAVKKRMEPHGIPLIINDRLDIALACRADGVHVGQSDMDCRIVRKIVGREMLVGVSVSTVEEALRAESDGADYLGVSPVFDTPTKTDTPNATGLEGLRSIRQSVTLPLVGIGGIKASNAARILEHGADGIAVVSAIIAAPEPLAAAQELRVAVSTGRVVADVCEVQERKS